MEALGIDARLLIAQIINFALFLYLFKRFIAKPFYSYLDSQKRAEREKEKTLSEAQKVEEKIKKERETILVKARSEAREIVSDAKETAQKQRQDIVNRAEKEAEEIRAKAKKQIEDERVAVYKEAKEHVLETSALIARSALKDFLSADHQKEIVDNILKKYDTTKLYEN